MSMAVEGIYVASEIRDGHHLPGQQMRTSPLTAGSGGGEWDDSLWSLSYTESEDQSSDTNAPIIGISRSLPHDKSSSLEPKAVMRRQLGLTRRHIERAKTLGCYPPLSTPRSLSASPHVAMRHLTTSGVPAALGLDCLELRRRSRNAETSAKWISHMPRADIERSLKNTSKTSSETTYRDLHGTIRRIQSLNRYNDSPPNRESCQMSWENLRTKPPRPPTTIHYSSAASPPRMVTAESEGRLEVEMRPPHHHQNPQPEDKLTEPEFFNRSVVSSTIVVPMDMTGKRTKSSLIKQKSAPAALPCRLRAQEGNPTSTCDIRDASSMLQTRSAIVPQGNETIPVSIENPVEASILQIPMIPVTMTAQTSPPPLKLPNEIPVEHAQNQQRQNHRRIEVSVPCLRQGTTVTLYQLMQFCDICTTHIPPRPSSYSLRRNSWEVGELIPGLEIRVSALNISCLSNSGLPQMHDETIALRGLRHTPGSAFTPINRTNQRKSERNSPLAPLLVITDDIFAAESMYFQPGQIILEVNGVNLFSVPVTSRQGLLTRLIAAILSAYDDGDGSLFVTLATPRPRSIRRIDNEVLEVQLDN